MHLNTALEKGEVWLADLPPGRGHEQLGTRPVVVVRDIATAGVALIFPITKTIGNTKFPFTFVVEPSKHNGLDFQSVALICQLRVVDKIRFIHRLGKLEASYLKMANDLLVEMVSFA